ncbi:MAG: type III-A CRISPR-associated protein Csm2 [Pseudomonadota bacterium]
MAEIIFWKDKANRKIDPTLFSIMAESLAKQLRADHDSSRGRANKRTQIRKFYDEVLRLDMEAKTRPQEWDNILPLIHMMVAKAAYARGRNLVSDNFLNFIKTSIKQISAWDDLRIFANFFEAFMGFYRQHGPAN